MDCSFDVKYKNSVSNHRSVRFSSFFLYQKLYLGVLNLSLWSTLSSFLYKVSLTSGFFLFFPFCLWKSSWSRTICWKDYSSSTELLLWLCKQSVVHIYVGLLLSSLFLSTGLCVYPSTNTTVLSIVAYKTHLEIKYTDSSQYITLFKNCFSYTSSFALTYTF